MTPGNPCYVGPNILFLTRRHPGKAYEIEEDPDVSASFLFPFLIHSFHPTSPSGKLTISVGHRNPVPVLI